MDNEKLKELAEQCIVDNQFAVGLLAQLIVDECILVKPISAWKKGETPYFYKKPTVFGLYTY